MPSKTTGGGNFMVLYPRANRLLQEMLKNVMRRLLLPFA